MFALIYTQQLAGPLFFGSVSLTLIFASLMDRHYHPRRHSGCDYERATGATEDSTEASLWIWLAGTAILTLPAVGNFLKFGL